MDLRFGIDPYDGTIVHYNASAIDESAAQPVRPRDSTAGRMVYPSLGKREKVCSGEGKWTAIGVQVRKNGELGLDNLAEGSKFTRSDDQGEPTRDNGG